MRYLLLAALAYMGLHAIGMLLFSAHVEAASYPFEIVTPALAGVGCIWRALKSTTRTKMLWMLAAGSMFLWSAGMSISVWESMFQRASNMIAEFSDFIFFVYGIPMLFVVALPTDSEWVPEFLWLDGIQTVMTACIVYVTIFSVTPFEQGVAKPISAAGLTYVFDIENVVLAVCASLRLFAHPKDRAERKVYLALTSFLWIYAIATGIYNHLFLILHIDAGLLDLLTDIPFVILFLAATVPTASRVEQAPATGVRPLAIFIDNASPILFTMALLALGVYNVREHFYTGISAVVIAFLVYGIRSTLLQGRYMHSQRALQETRDRLEEMSLKDGLTGVANRRCFDQILELEWNRAIRLQHSLSLLMIDVDYFKNLNDTYGHRIGDECLTQVAGALCSMLPRSGDLLARYGGEEFVAILPATNRAGAEVVADRMRFAVRSLNIQNETLIGQFATVSIGIAVCESAASGVPAFLVEASDRALYQAKQNGRDRAEFASMQHLIEISI